MRELPPIREIELTPKLMILLTASGYQYLRSIPGRGICGLSRMIYTTGIVFGINETSYWGRYCYEYFQDALTALREWDGIGDPPGEWIKFKGYGGDRSRIPDPYDRVDDEDLGS